MDNKLDLKGQTLKDWQRFLRHVDSAYNKATNMPIANLFYRVFDSKLVNKTENAKQEIEELIEILNEKCEVENVNMAVYDENYFNNFRLIHFFSINFNKLEKEDILKMLALDDKCKQYDEKLKYSKHEELVNQI